MAGKVEWWRAEISRKGGPFVQNGIGLRHVDLLTRSMRKLSADGHVLDLPDGESVTITSPDGQTVLRYTVARTSVCQHAHCGRAIAYNGTMWVGTDTVDADEDATSVAHRHAPHPAR